MGINPWIYKARGKFHATTSTEFIQYSARNKRNINKAPNPKLLAQLLLHLRAKGNKLWLKKRPMQQPPIICEQVHSLAMCACE